MIQAEINQATFDALAERLEVQEGIALKGAVGTVSSHGATVAWSYIQGELSMNVIHAPFDLKSVVESKLRDALMANGVVVR